MFNIMYPNELLRGIPNDCIDEFGYPATNLFTFDNSSQQRTDGYKEESVTWRDDEKAVSILLNQKKEDGQIQFKIGVAVLSRHEIDRLIRVEWVRQSLSYEREKTPENKYHGNLLLKVDVPKRVKKKIMAQIACFASDNPIITRNDAKPVNSSWWKNISSICKWVYIPFQH